MPELKPFTVKYKDTTYYSVSVLARSGEDAEEIADYCIQSYGMDHPAVFHPDYVYTEVYHVADGLENSQTPFDPTQDDGYQY